MTAKEKSGLDKKWVKSDNICQFHEGDKVVHVPEGVCVITEISIIRNSDYNENEYYKIVPVVDDSRAIYIPLSSAENHIRRLRSKEEIQEILDYQKKAKPLWEKKEQKRIAERNKAIRDDNGMKVAKLIKAYHYKRKRDHINVLDSVWLKIAEQFLYSEVAEVLGMDYKEVLLKMTDG